MLSGNVASWFLDKSSFSSILSGLSNKLVGITLNPLLDNKIVFKPLGSVFGRALEGSMGLGAGLLGEEGVTLILFPSRLWLADKDLSFGSDCIAFSDPGVSLLWSTFSDFNTFRFDKFGSSFLSLFLDKSSVVSFGISKTGLGQASNLCSLSDKTPVFRAFSSFCSTTFRPVLLCGCVFPIFWYRCPVSRILFAEQKDWKFWYPSFDKSDCNWRCSLYTA
mmetsp:Transcript_14333/g.36002  ORF Transcript_14333/g.36002 Transcript_14333/m.36002 type:complete len:220 (-) Transcript_14333:37-696(-)